MTNESLLDELDKLYVAGNPTATQTNVAEKIFELMNGRKSDFKVMVVGNGDLKPRL